MIVVLLSWHFNLSNLAFKNGRFFIEISHTINLCANLILCYIDFEWLAKSLRTLFQKLQQSYSKENFLNFKPIALREALP
jgi:hypothetical protein